MFLRLITEVPDEITGPRQRIELRRCAGLLDSESICAYHVADFNTKDYRNQYDQRNFAHENQQGTQRTTETAG